MTAWHGHPLPLGAPAHLLPAPLAPGNGGTYSLWEYASPWGGCSTAAGTLYTLVPCPMNVLPCRIVSNIEGQSVSGAPALGGCRTNSTAWSLQAKSKPRKLILKNAWNCDRQCSVGKTMLTCIVATYQQGQAGTQMLHNSYTLMDTGLPWLMVPDQVTDLCEAGTCYPV